MSEHDRYLWDTTGPPDPDVAALEEMLRPLRAAPLAPIARTVRRSRGAALLAAATLVITAALAIRLTNPAPRLPGWAATTGASRLVVGGGLTTKIGDVVELRVGKYGTVTVHGDSHVALVAAEDDREHRMRLDYGRITALITAPPRLFFVETPAALAVDLGCAYDLEVNADGDGTLVVTMGSVALERDGRGVIVPQGARCLIDGASGPGTPWFEDATDAFASALARIDRGDLTALDRLLGEARERDALTLWNLIPRVAREHRLLVVDRLIDLAGSPTRVDVEMVLDAEPEALEAWWSELEYIW